MYKNSQILSPVFKLDQSKPAHVALKDAFAGLSCLEKNEKINMKK